MAIRAWDPSARLVMWVEGEPPTPPRDAAEARARLERGAAAFTSVGNGEEPLVVQVGPGTFGLPAHPGEVLLQEPFAAVLGCSDARVPAELILGQTTNDLFVVRVAGNVPGSDCVGSLHYAEQNLPSLHLVVVLGHSRCGAIKAAVNSMLQPRSYLTLVHDQALRGIVDSLLAGVRMADHSLKQVHGTGVRGQSWYRDALVALSSLANAAISATVLQQDLRSEVVLGLYDLERRSVGIPGREGWHPGLLGAPGNDDELSDLLLDAAASVPAV